MKLIVNGSAVEAAPTDLRALLVERGIDPDRSGLAVAVNGRVVPRARWTSEPLAEGDEIEIITAMQGG